MISALRLVDRAVTRLALGLAMALLALMSLITFWQVITRFLLEAPSTWSEVAARSLMIWMVYLGLSVTVRTGSLIAVDVLIERLRGGARQAAAAMIAAVSLAVFGVMVWYGWTLAERTSSQSIAGLVDPFTGAPVSIAWVYAAIPVGAALSIIALAARLAEELSGAVEPGAGPATRDV